MTDQKAAPAPSGDPSAQARDARARAARWGTLLAGSPFEQLVELDEFGVVVAVSDSAQEQTAPFRPELSRQRPSDPSSESR